MGVPIEVDIPCDPTQIDHTGTPWTFLDEAAHPERILEGAIVVTGDAEDPVFARVASLTERPSDIDADFYRVPGLPGRLACFRRAGVVLLADMCGFDDQRGAISAVRCGQSARPWNARLVSNDIDLLRETVDSLRGAGFQTAVFGGWAEELHRLSGPRPHHDIDLIVLDAEIVKLDAFVQERGEIVAKRQTHKRAFTAAGVLIELFIVNTVDGMLLTNFWGSCLYEWPDLGPVEVDGLPVATVAALTAYRQDHASIRAHRQ